jgi:ureidoacrylate peracid hydrolase
MNGVNLPQSVVDRVVARRGTPHPFDALDPARTALVVVDLQNGFMDDTVGHAVCPAARDIVPEVNRLAAATRMSGGGVFWIKNTFNADSAREWSVMRIGAAFEAATGLHERRPSLAQTAPQGHATAARSPVSA